MKLDPSEGAALAPQVSVVIACRNVSDLLGGQLEALARQTCPVPWEVLVCDNGSTDGTVALAESWADRLPLRVIDSSAVLGAGPARNAGVQAARGEFIGFCDADDEVADGWLETLYRALVVHPFVAGRFEAERLNSPRALRSRRVDQQTGLQWSFPMAGLPHAGGGNLGIHRSVFLSAGGFDPVVRYLQDTDLCWRVQLAGHPLVFVPDLVIHMRLRSTLRGMYRQGHNYGASLAMLERRYAEVGPPAGSPTSAVELTEPGAEGVTGRGAVRGALRLARRLLANRSSIGELAWQLGWHVGHRSPVPIPPGAILRPSAGRASPADSGG